MRNKICVVHIIDSISLGGGAERMLLDILEEFHNVDDNFVMKVIYFTKSNFYSYETAGIWEDKNLKKFGSNIIKHCSASAKFSILGKPCHKIDDLKNVLIEYKPDIIHSHLQMSELISRGLILNNVLFPAARKKKQKQGKPGRPPKEKIELTPEQKEERAATTNSH